MHCPRCGMDNDDSRVACWSCFAQLKPPACGRPLKIDLRRQEQNQAELTSPPEPAIADVTPLISSIPEPQDQLTTGASDVDQTVPESAVLTDSSVLGPELHEQSAHEPDLDFSSVDTLSAGAESTEVEPAIELGSLEPTEYLAIDDQLPIDEGNSAAWHIAFELGEEDATLSPSDLIVPGLAYTQPEGEEESSFDIGEVGQEVDEADLQSSADDGDGKPKETA